MLETPFFNIYIHKFYKEDQEPFRHDHPWNFFTLMLNGGYFEDCPGYIVKYSYRGCYAYHRAQYPHRIIKLENDKPCTSLVITSARIRTWGYHTNEGWVDNKTYREQKYKVD